MSVRHFLVPTDPIDPFCHFSLKQSLYQSKKKSTQYFPKVPGPFQFQTLLQPFLQSGITVPLSCLQGKILIPPKHCCNLISYVKAFPKALSFFPFLSICICCIYLGALVLYIHVNEYNVLFLYWSFFSLYNAFLCLFLEPFWKVYFVWVLLPPLSYFYLHKISFSISLCLHAFSPDISLF